MVTSSSGTRKTYAVPVRLFVAVRPTPAAVSHLRALLGTVRTSDPEKWHVTLAFLGDVANDDRLEAGLAAVASRHEPFGLRLHGSGRFGPRATWAGLAGDVEPLRALAADVVDACRRAGIALERRAYQPHLTVGRVDPALLAAYDGPTWPVREIELVQSVLGKRALHTVLRAFPLAGQTAQQAPHQA
jgi:2'-5' RNA ligase